MFTLPEFHTTHKIPNSRGNAAHFCVLYVEIQIDMCLYYLALPAWQPHNIDQSLGGD